MRIECTPRASSFLALALLGLLVGPPRVIRGEDEEPARSGSGHEPGAEGRLRLSAERRAAAGIETVPCSLRNLPELIHTTGTLEVNADSISHLSSRLPGFVLSVAKAGHLGVRVERGDELAVIHSPEFGKAQSDYRKALALLSLRQRAQDREKDLFNRKVSSGRELIETETDLALAKIDLEAARNQLEAFGQGAEEIAAAGAATAPLGCLPLRAPIAGTVIEKHLVPGEHVDTEGNLFTIADLDSLWLFADIYERDIARIAVGQAAQAYFTSAGEIPYPGTIAHVAELMNTETRTLRVRIELKNPEGKLKPGMFGAVDLAVAARVNIPAVPEIAVQTHRQHPILFVEVEPGVFERRLVRTGVRFGGFVEALEGVRADEQVVTSGSFLLKSELEKESFEAGD